MSSEGEKTSEGTDFDVVVVHGATGDGEGAKVLRFRPGQLEAGEVRPMRDGQPLAPGGEVVRLVERPDAACVYDVKVDCKVPSLPASSDARAAGPPQVATRAYRDSWERTFAKNAKASQPN